MELNDSSPMPIGKYKGKAMEDVPAQWLMWFWEQNKRAYIEESRLSVNQQSIMEYIDENLDVLEYELKKE